MKRTATDGERLTHVHRTFHFEVSAAELNEIAVKTLGVGLEAIVGASGDPPRGRG